MSKVQLSIGGNMVDVPKLMDLPVRTVMKVVTESDSNKQFALALDILCENLSEDDICAVDNMSVDEAVALVSDWLDKSAPEKEEPEIV